MPKFSIDGPLDPLKDKNIIINRSELENIVTQVKYESAYIGLRSARQTGKTTLVFQMSKNLRSQNYGVAYIYLSNEQSKFYQLLCQNIVNELAWVIDKNEFSKMPNIDAVIDIDGFTAYLIWLAQATQNARKLVIIFDEVGNVPSALSTKFFSNFRRFHHMGKYPANQADLYKKFVFIFVGALDLYILSKGYNSPLANVCKFYNLKDFTKKQIAQLVSQIEDIPQELEWIYTSIYEWTGGHPYLTQRLCRLIEENQHIFQNMGDMENFSIAIRTLIEKKIIYGDDNNLSNILNTLKEKPEYRQSVYDILHNSNKLSVKYRDDLIILGVIKKNKNNNLEIRNKIYKEKLTHFLADWEPKPHEL